jgi:hypothetical protein
MYLSVLLNESHSKFFYNRHRKFRKWWIYMADFWPSAIFFDPPSTTLISIIYLTIYLSICLHIHTFYLPINLSICLDTHTNSKVNATNSLFLKSSLPRKLTRVGAYPKAQRALTEVLTNCPPNKS